MSKHTTGIHHITAYVGHPQENVDFYAGVLGLRLVKQTVNFDDPSLYHLYFGDEYAKPGTIITFFPVPNGPKGIIGDGQVGVTTYVVPKGSMNFWKERLTKKHVSFKEVTRFNEDYLQFEDTHGLRLEIVEREEGQPNTWLYEDITPKTAIKGFGGAILYSLDPQASKDVLENIMGLEYVSTEGDYQRFKSSADIGNIVDLKMTTTGLGRMGVGTVHHIAWRANDKKDHVQWQELVAKSGYNVTPVIDRNYFDAIYFREPGQILYEIATDTPGFAHDESQETMGEKLMLPSQYESRRQAIEDNLIPIKVK